MTINVLLIDNRACQRDHTHSVLQQSDTIYCETVAEVHEALGVLESRKWDVLIFALPARVHCDTVLLHAISQCEKRPDLVLTAHDYPSLLTNTMRLARARGIHVRGYAVDPINPAVLLGLVTAQQASLPSSQARSSHPRVPVEDVAMAFSGDEVQVAFLPQKACIAHTTEIPAVRTILRWLHPRHGQMETPELVRLANSSEHANMLFHYSLRHIAEALSLWRDQDFHPAVSCVTPLSLMLRGNDFDGLHGEICSYGLHARDLTFELDLQDLNVECHRTLAERMLLLRQQGVEFAINNYGVSGTTLANLIDLPVSEIRLAPDLIFGIGFDPFVQRLVSGTVGLAKILDIRVVATSVQRVSDIEILSTLGCDFVEGPAVGEARSAEALAQWNRNRPGFGIKAKDRR